MKKYSFYSILISLCTIVPIYCFLRIHQRLLHSEFNIAGRLLIKYLLLLIIRLLVLLVRISHIRRYNILLRMSNRALRLILISNIVRSRGHIAHLLRRQTIQNLTLRSRRILRLLLLLFLRRVLRNCNWLLNRYSVLRVSICLLRLLNWLLILKILARF